MMLPMAVASSGPAITGSAGRVGGKLAEKSVFAAAADDMDLPDRARRDRAQFFEDDPIFQGQAFEHAADDRGVRFRNRLAGHPAEAPDGLGHVRRVEKIRVVGVDHSRKCGRGGGRGGQVGIAERTPARSIVSGTAGRAISP